MTSLTTFEQWDLWLKIAKAGFPVDDETTPGKETT